MGTPAAGTPGFKSNRQRKSSQNAHSDDPYLAVLGQRHDASIFEADLEDPRDEDRQFEHFKWAHIAKQERDTQQLPWHPSRLEIYDLKSSDKAERMLQFQEYMSENGLLNTEKDLLDMQLLALRRVGQLKKPLGFSL